MVLSGSFRPRVCILHKDDLKGSVQVRTSGVRLGLWLSGWRFAVVLGRAAHCACVLHRHQLEMPGHYSHLAAFYEDKKGVLHAGPGRGGSLPPVYWLPSIHRYMYPEMKVRLAILSHIWE